MKYKKSTLYIRNIDSKLTKYKQYNKYYVYIRFIKQNCVYIYKVRLTV